MRPNFAATITYSGSDVERRRIDPENMPGSVKKKFEIDSLIQSGDFDSLSKFVGQYPFYVSKALEGTGKMLNIGTGEIIDIDTSF